MGAAARATAMPAAAAEAQVAEVPLTPRAIGVDPITVFLSIRRVVHGGSRNETQPTLAGSALRQGPSEQCSGHGGLVYMSASVPWRLHVSQGPEFAANLGLTFTLRPVPHIFALAPMLNVRQRRCTRQQNRSCEHIHAGQRPVRTRVDGFSAHSARWRAGSSGGRIENSEHSLR